MMPIVSSGERDALSTEPSPTTLAERLDHIWRQKKMDESRDISHRRLIEELGANPQIAPLLSKDEPFSTTHLNNLRRGVATNPGINVLRMLGIYFDIDPAYFLTTSSALAERLLVERHLRNTSEAESLLNIIEQLPPTARELVRATAYFLLTHDVSMMAPPTEK